jgi:hypothetical protein
MEHEEPGHGTTVKSLHAAWLSDIEHGDMGHETWNTGLMGYRNMEHHGTA